MIVSHSEVDAFLLCERRWHYAFREKLQKKHLSESLRRGITGHEFMQVFFNVYKSTRDFQKGLMAVDSRFGELLQGAAPEDAKLLTDLHVRIVGWLLHFQRTVLEWEPVYIEHIFRVPMPYIRDDLTFAFQPDLVVKTRGQLEVVDWKFPYNFYNSTALGLLPQLPKYISGLRKLDMIVRKGHYAEVRYRSLKDPSPSQLYKLTTPPIPPMSLADTWQDYADSVAQIAILKEDPEMRVKRTANNLVCNSCSFKELCVAEKQGSDGKMIREMMYKPSDYGYVEVDQ